jgi:predicted DNA-binding WGR domain protein
MDNMPMLVIQRRDHEKSMHRFYALTVHPDLISGWTLQREWGRIGSPGRVVIEPFGDEHEAQKAGAEITAARRRRGYRSQPIRFGEGLSHAGSQIA